MYCVQETIISTTLYESTEDVFLIFFLTQPFMGDNYCDAVNNRAFCNYDGGDCCQSTVKTKKVRRTIVRHMNSVSFF